MVQCTCGSGRLTRRPIPGSAEAPMAAEFSARRGVLFDLDGTLTDSRIGITRSVAYALSTYGITVEDTDSLCCFIGPPLDESFTKYFGFPTDQAKEAVARYRDYYRERGIYENRLYPGIRALLADLHRTGRCVALATTKPQIFAERICEYFGVAPDIDEVVGSEMDGRRVRKPELIECAFRRTGLTPGDALMVGDRSLDILGARSHGIPGIGVLYGFGDLPELEEAGADAIAPTVAALRALLMC